MSFLSRLSVRCWMTSGLRGYVSRRDGLQFPNTAVNLCRHCCRPHAWAGYSTRKQEKPKKKFKKPSTIRRNMTVKQLSFTLTVPVSDILESLQIATGSDFYTDENDMIGDLKILKEVMKSYNVPFTVAADKNVNKPVVRETDETSKHSDVPKQPPPQPNVLVSRPPIVTIMGHVDHGKTTLLDALRKSKVVDQEFGGITQHIGAFSAKLPSGQSITFLDTPGHAAFSAMRARGAAVTDMIVLVIAAEDGVMQQTIESIQLAQEANVPIIVAINKMDKPEANAEKVKLLLSQYGVNVEDVGGDVQAVPISALKGTNLDMLQESIVTQAEFMELKADPIGRVEGSVVESRTEMGRGKLATAIVQRGTLRRGDLVVAGTTWARVRAMYNDKGQVIDEVPPATPVEISGWKDLPSAGEEMLQVSSEKQLKSVLAYRNDLKQSEKIQSDQKVIDENRKKHTETYRNIRAKRLAYHGANNYHFTTPNDIFMKLTTGAKFQEDVDPRTKPGFPIIIKGDVDGTVEAILDTLATFHSELCTLDIIDSGVGDVTEQDLKLAETFNGEIFAFNVSLSPKAAAIQHDVPVKHHKVIYSMFEDLIDSINDSLPVTQVEEVIGEAKVLQVFYVNDKKRQVPVAGCRCTEGTLNRRLNFKVLRDDQVLYEGPLLSLKHHKKEVETIKTNVECGVSVDPSEDLDFKVDDSVICFKYVEQKQTLEWEPGYT